MPYPKDFQMAIASWEYKKLKNLMAAFLSFVAFITAAPCTIGL